MGREMEAPGRRQLTAGGCRKLQHSHSFLLSFRWYSSEMDINRRQFSKMERTYKTCVGQFCKEWIPSLMNWAVDFTNECPNLSIVNNVISNSTLHSQLDWDDEVLVITIQLRRWKSDLSNNSSILTCCTKTDDIEGGIIKRRCRRLDENFQQVLMFTVLGVSRAA